MRNPTNEFGTQNLVYKCAEKKCKQIHSKYIPEILNKNIIVLNIK
jgi:hypothetical protein